MLPSNAPEWEASKPPPPQRRTRVDGLVLTLVLLVALVAVIAFALTQLQTTRTVRPAAAPATVVDSAGTPADAATRQAIQDVIRKLDEAQAEAIATNDESVMAATATPEFFAEQVIINQMLLAGGVVAIKLINLEWGEITLNDNQATANVYETWSTTFKDGTTEQARELNVYTLAKDASRGWIVKSDVHPEARR